MEIEQLISYEILKTQPEFVALMTFTANSNKITKNAHSQILSLWTWLAVILKFEFFSSETQPGLKTLRIQCSRFKSQPISVSVSSRTFFLTLHKKWSFPLTMSSVNVTKSAVSCGFGRIYWRSPNGKLHFSCSVIDRGVFGTLPNIVDGIVNSKNW